MWWREASLLRSNMTWLSGRGRAYLAPGLGLVFGILAVITSTHKDAPLWWVWAPIAIALTTTAGAVFTYGLGRWGDLAELSRRHQVRQVRVRDVAALLVAMVIVTLAADLGSMRLPEPGRANWRAVALITITVVGGAPGAVVAVGIRQVARDESAPDNEGEQVALLVTLRRLLQRLLPAEGSLVALSTLATGAVLALQQSLRTVSEPDAASGLPPQFVLVFGGAGSLLVALFYVPAATALQRRGERLRDKLLPLEKAHEVSAILGLAEDRHKLEQLLGIDRSAVADLQTGLIILGPLLASAAATFLPP